MAQVTATRVRFCDVKPYDAPASLDELRGPDKRFHSVAPTGPLLRSNASKVEDLGSNPGRGRDRKE